METNLGEVSSFGENFSFRTIHHSTTTTTTHPRGLATLVVVGVPSTQRSDLLGDCLGKRGASQGSPLRVAPESCTERYDGHYSLPGALSCPTSRTPHHGECLLAGRLTRSLWVAPSRSCKRWQAVARRRRRWWWRLGWGCGAGRAASCSSWTWLSTCPLFGVCRSVRGGRAALGQGC